MVVVAGYLDISPWRSTRFTMCSSGDCICMEILLLHKRYSTTVGGNARSVWSSFHSFTVPQWSLTLIYVQSDFYDAPQHVIATLLYPTLPGHAHTTPHHTVIK